MKKLSFSDYLGTKNINEIFQILGLQDIDKIMKGRNIFYRFEDQGITYEVQALDTKNDHFLNEKLKDNLPKRSFSGVLVNAYSPYLTWSKNNKPNSMDVSNVGNFGFVYNKLLSSIKDLVENHNVDLLKFEGYTSGMDTVYYRMIKRFRSMGDPKLFFHPMGNNEWINDEFILKQNPMIQKVLYKIIEQEEKQHQEFIGFTKRQRNDEKNIRRSLNQSPEVAQN